MAARRRWKGGNRWQRQPRRGVTGTGRARERAVRVVGPRPPAPKRERSRVAGARRGWREGIGIRVFTRLAPPSARAGGVPIPPPAGGRGGRRFVGVRPARIASIGVRGARAPVGISPGGAALLGGVWRVAHARKNPSPACRRPPTCRRPHAHTSARRGERGRGFRPDNERRYVENTATPGSQMVPSTPFQCQAGIPKGLPGEPVSGRVRWERVRWRVRWLVARAGATRERERQFMQADPEQSDAAHPTRHNCRSTVCASST